MISWVRLAKPADKIWATILSPRFQTRAVMGQILVAVPAGIIVLPTA